MRTKSQEAEAKLRHRTALLELQQVLATTANEAKTPQAAMQDALDVVCAYTGWQVGHVFYVRTGEPVSYVPGDIWRASDAKRFAQFQQRTREVQFAPGTELPGWVCAQRKTVWLENMACPNTAPMRSGRPMYSPRMPQAIPNVIRRNGIKERNGIRYALLAGAIGAILSILHGERCGSPTANPPRVSG